MELRLSLVEREQKEFREAIRDLRDYSERQAKSLEALVRLEERHAESREALSRAFASLKEHNDRLNTIEQNMPGLLEIRRWVVGGVIGIISLVGISIAGLVILKPNPYYVYATPPASPVVSRSDER